MESLPSVPKGTVVAAVAFDDQTKSVVSAAVSLAHRFDMELRLIHVVADPYDPTHLELPGYYAYVPVDLPSLALIKAEQDRLMRPLVAALGMGDRARGEILVGDTEEAVIAYARLHRANVLVTACAPDYGRFSAAFSTTLALMARAPLPLLVVGAQRTPDFARKSLRILVADDLQPASQEAVRRAFELAVKVPGSRIRQVHVRAHPGLHPLTSAAERSAQLKAGDDVCREKLLARGDPYRDRAVTAGAEFELEVRHGVIPVEISAAIEDFQPDLLVFGRHMPVRTRPFLIGKLPFQQMLRGPCSVLLIPPAGELYANLAFPAG